MLWKGLVMSGAVAIVAFAVIAALAFGPVPAGGTLAQPATGNVVVLPNGVAAPQLQPVQPASAPVLLSEGSLVNLPGRAGESDEASVLKLTAGQQTTVADTTEQKAVMGCGGK
ncbi:MAG: hypothetical protein ACUVS4_04365 [Chloroflexaceae bacterium]